MAPTSARRSGHSRRAQFGLFTGYVLATIGAAVGAVLLGISLWRPSSFNGFRTAASDTVAPVGEVAAKGRAEGQGLFDSISGYLAAGSQNAALKQEVELARIRLKEGDGNSAEANLPDAVAQAVLQDASKQLNVPARQLRIVRSEARQWPNSCLGLPQTDRGCAQAIVPGWRVMVEGAQQGLIYRTNESGSLVMLENTGTIGNATGVSIPSNELPPPLAKDAVFRVISTGGITGRMEETTLMNNGQMIKKVGSMAPEITSVSPQRLEQFKRLLSIQPMAQYNGLSYPAPQGAADYMNLTLTSQYGTVRFADMAQDQLPKPLQVVMLMWNVMAQGK